LNDLTIYQEKILILASENKKSIAIEDFNYSFDMKNPMCGDEVKVRINIINNKIVNISALVRGCALCEASAGLVVKTFNQNNLPKNNFIENFKKWLNDTDIDLPDDLPKEIEIFKPIREISNRHKCITMPFEATIKSIEKLTIKK
jgi:nitrogen fixation NifU-like protein|tara:strand:- start:343 stop:777 length:435 start_codon:yes stop_codon:yes gene_type:complete